MRKPVYFDNHATTRLDPRVLDIMLPYLTEKFGNAASRSHSFGWEAEKAVERARSRIAGLAGAAAREIVFTSGATESDNLALKGIVEAYSGRRLHLVTVATEHKAVLDSARRLERRGCQVTVLMPQPDGLIDPAQVAAAIRPETALVSVMYANNEIGVVQPIRAIGAICREKGVPFHCDAAQAFGKIPVNVVEDHIDLMSMSAHKMYGPKGIGALYVRRRGPRLSIVPQIDGGGHEGGIRSGTLNVPAIVGFGEACAICAREMPEEARVTGGLRDRLKTSLETGLDRVSVNGSMEHRLPGNLNMSFAFVEAETLMMALADVAVSSGSACSSAVAEPSYVLRSLGVSEEQARGAIRFGLGRFSTEEEVDYVAARVIETVQKLRGRSPLYETA
ncbi:MAG TPA: IscS subfamily cysteine desulfurase [Bryobacteraceae bacterium]|nr:IscS subfamily cysteine desulfurase [Bryobacteraceae bacterium]